MSLTKLSLDGDNLNATDFPSPAEMSLTKLSLDGNNYIIPAQGEFRSRDVTIDQTLHTGII